MFSADAEIKFQLTIDTKTGEASLKNLSQELDKTEKKAESISSKVSGSFNTLGDGLTKFGGNLTKMVTVPVTGLGIASLKTAVDFVKLKESSMGVFKQMLGGADAADDMYESLLNIAKASTYSQEAFLTAGKTLVGMGTSANNTSKYLQAITNAVAGFGGSSYDIEELAAVFGKVQAKGKVLTDDLNMLSERGVNGLQILAAHYKVTTDEMQDMVSHGMVPATEGLDILCDGMENGYTYADQFHQGMSGMAQSLKNGTLTGALDSLKSSFRNMSVQMWDAFNNKPEMIAAVNAIGNAMGKLPTIMGPITSAIGPMFQSFADKLNKIAELAEKHPALFENIVKAIVKLAAAGPVLVTIGKGFKTISSTITGISKGINTFKKITTAIKEFHTMTKLATAAIKAQSAATNVMAGAQKTLNVVMHANPIGLIIAAIVTLIAIFVALYTKCEGFRTVVNNVVGAVIGFFQNLWATVSNIFSIIYSFIVSIIQGIWNFLSPFFDFIKNAFILYVAIVTTVWGTIFNIIYTVVSSILSFIGTIVGWVYNNVLLPIFNFFTTVFGAIYNGIVWFINGFISLFITISGWVYNNVLLPIMNFFSFAFNFILGIVSNVVNWIKNAFSTIASFVKTMFSNIKNFISNMFGAIGGFIKAPINGVIDCINKVLKAMNKVKVPDWVPGLGGKGVNFKMIPKLSVGTNYVQSEGLAYLHEGEAVVPKKYNPAIGGYGNSNQIVYVNVNAEMDVNKFGRAFVRDIKLNSGGAKNSYNYGGGV